VDNLSTPLCIDVCFGLPLQRVMLPDDPQNSWIAIPLAFACLYRRNDWEDDLKERKEKKKRDSNQHEGKHTKNKKPKIKVDLKVQGFFALIVNEG
jgi:hypothetical protein